ncbi:hypothetical protein QR680_008285 [Steinernema hermaphroditum]|uniref:G-protein coupled receptors family 1 profile domain-containing protein n=1 Tax=Steinernema hermaphroditum TaxID=289476 RepID=A0AA39IG22_9BILA|nr:hypothetical protein QR680_008285 [Steinernema hermaphroditum]
MVSTMEIYMVLYIVIGCIVVTVNVPICCLIYFSKALRPSKELILIGGLCLADAVQSLADILAGGQRLVLYAHQQQDGMETSLRCFFQPFNILFFFGYHLVGIMSMLVSIDRMFAVFMPLKHRVMFSRRNGITMTIGALTFSALAFIVCLVLQTNFNVKMSILCFGSQAYLPMVWEYVHHIRLMPVLISIALYVPISWKLYRIVKTQKHAVGWKSENYKRLANFTKTVGFVSVGALILLVIPDLIVTYFKGFIGDYDKALFIVAHSKAILNIFIFTMRHGGLRKTCATFLRRLTPFRIVVHVKPIDGTR